MTTNFTRTRPSGWAYRGKPTYTEMNQLDIDHAKALNASTDGGQIDGYVTVSATGDMSFSSGSALSISTGATLTTVGVGAHVNLEGDASSLVDVGTVTADNLNAGDTIINGTSDFNGAASFFDDVSIADGYITLGTPTVVFSPSRSLVKYLPVAMGNVQSTGYFVQAATTDRMWWNLDLPVGCTIVSIEFGVDGAAGHGGILPTMPYAFLYQQDPSTLTLSSIGSATDTSANTTIYEAFHTVTMTVGAPYYAATPYFLTFAGESGGSFQAGMTLYWVRANYTLASWDPGYLK